MEFELTIKSDNAAFEYPEAEVKRILENVISKLGETDGAPIMDNNGNKVGLWFLDVPADKEITCPECDFTYVDEGGGTAASDEETSMADHNRCSECQTAWTHGELESQQEIE